MSKIIKLYCEGKRGSHDYDIMEKVIENLSSHIQIDSIGSIRGAGAIIQYKEEKEVQKSDFYLLFRDRDFDKEIPETPKLEQDTQKTYCYYSYRNTIENYLFNEKSFLDFMKVEKLMSKYQFSTEEDVKNKFIDAANRIKGYQIARHTMGKLRTGETNFGTKLTSKSGVLPSNLSKEYCKKEALERINNAKSFTDNWNEDNFNEIYDKFSIKFNNDFMLNLDFFIFFHGKDFATSLKTILPDFPLERYYKFSKKEFDYTLFQDLVELRKLIESNL